MPRTSSRQKLITRLSLLKSQVDDIRDVELSLAIFDRIGDNGTGNLTPEFTSLWDPWKDAIDIAMSNVGSRRYIHRPKKYRTMQRSIVNIFERDLEDNKNDDNSNHQQPCWLTDEEFLQKYRVTRASFDELVKLIQDNPVFKNDINNKRKKAQVPPAHQLMVFLHFLGTEGSGASNPRMRNVFGIGRGTAQLYRDRCCVAISSLCHLSVFWPDANERKVIARRMHANYNWPNCIGIADGTLIPLTYSPQSDDAGDYSGRKYDKSLVCMVICDDRRLIRHFLAGFPGSAHDSRVFNATSLAQDHRHYFGDKYYLIGDSAFANTDFFVSAFKKPRGSVLTSNPEKFNTHVAKLRIQSEHTIGILKARFPILKSLPMIITNDPKSVRKIVRYIECAIILHNLLLVTEGDDVDEWLHHPDYDDDTSVVEVDNIEFDPTLTMPIAPGGPNDVRRSRLMNYFRDYVY